MYNLSRRNFTTKAIENWKSTNQKLNEKIKGTIFEKWIKYWQLVVKDYKDVAISAKEDIKKTPSKSALYFTGAAFVGLAIQLNPDVQNFRATYIRCANELNLVPAHLVNPRAVDHLKYIENCFNRQYIRHTNLGILSIIWVDKYSKECDTYETNCSYLKVPYWKIRERILDIGFLNVWWIISRNMIDYDINY